MNLKAFEEYALINDRCNQYDINKRTSNIKTLIKLFPFFSNIQSFDREVLDKAEEYLKYKQRNWALRTLIYPGVYAHKEEISGWRYLQDKHKKLLEQYEKSNNTIFIKLLGQLGISFLGVGGMTYSMWCNSTSNYLIWFTAAAVSEWYACLNVIYLFNNVPPKTYQEEQVVYGKVLGKKINEKKVQINRDKEILEAMYKNRLHFNSPPKTTVHKFIAK